MLNVGMCTVSGFRTLHFCTKTQPLGGKTWIMKKVNKIFGNPNHESESFQSVYIDVLRSEIYKLVFSFTTCFQALS